MITLGSANAASDHYSARVSESVRTLSLAGLGVVWILAGGTLRGLTKDLLWCALLLVVTLAVDFAHYVIGHAVWNRFIERAESRFRDAGQPFGPATEVRQQTDREVRPIEWAYRLKLAAVVVAYARLAVAIGWRLAGW